MDLRSPLGKVRGLGSAKNGSHHWWMQRVSALALIPLVIWFVLLVIKASMHSHQLVDYLQRPFNAVLMILFLGTALYHGALGLRVVIEDYVSCHCTRNLMIIVTNFFTIVTAVAAILAVITVHIDGVQNHRKGKKESSYHVTNKSSFDSWKDDVLGRIRQERSVNSN